MLDSGAEACECMGAGARRVERAAAAGSGEGASRLWRRAHFLLRPPRHFSRACRRHVVSSPGQPLSPRLRSRGPCAWARGLSPIGGRRLRGGSLVIGRRRGGRGPGTLLVTPAPAWGVMKELAAVGMLTNCSVSGGRGNHPSNARVARRLRGEAKGPKERERVVAWPRATKGGIPNSRGTQLATRWGHAGPWFVNTGTGIKEERSSRCRGARRGV